MTVRIFQIQIKEPVPRVYFQEDLFQGSHSEWPFHEGTVQTSEIEDGPEAAILFGDE